MRMATSAWEVPVIMFLMKSRWPGASITVYEYLGVSNCTSTPQQWNAPQAEGNTHYNGMHKATEPSRTQL